MTSEVGVQIHEDIRSESSFGIHWGTFKMTSEVGYQLHTCQVARPPRGRISPFHSSQGGDFENTIFATYFHHLGRL